MTDETVERLIVMGGTAEPGVFQIEVLQDNPLKGSILLVFEKPRTDFDYPCGCAKVWEATHKARNLVNEQRRLHGLAVDNAPGSLVCCACTARRLD